VVWSNRHSGWEFPDEAGYPDGVGTLDQGRRELVTEVGSWGGGRADPGLTSDYPLEFGSDDADSKYEAYLDGQTIATLTYRRLQQGRRVALLTTVVKREHRHHGVATELIARALDDLRAEGVTVTVICPLVREFIDRFPDYADLVDPAHPGVQSTQQALVAADVEDSADDVYLATEEGLSADGRYDRE
jgi:predicted GNAT family acetyltransferase